MSNESLIHSWTIDLSDWETKELFSEEDWCEIEKVVFKQPLVDENFARSLSRFRNASIRISFLPLYCAKHGFAQQQIIPDLSFIAEFLGPNYYGSKESSRVNILSGQKRTI